MISFSEANHYGRDGSVYSKTIKEKNVLQTPSYFEVTPYDV